MDPHAASQLKSKSESQQENTWAGWCPGTAENQETAADRMWDYRGRLLPPSSPIPVLDANEAWGSAAMEKERPLDQKVTCWVMQRVRNGCATCTTEPDPGSSSHNTHGSGTRVQSLNFWCQTRWRLGKPRERHSPEPRELPAAFHKSIAYPANPL